IRRFAANEDQLASGKVHKSSRQGGARNRGDGSQLPIRELATDGGANLCDLPDLAKPIKACGQRAEQRRRNGGRREWADCDVSVTCILQQPRFFHFLFELLRGQKNPLRLIYYPFPHTARQPPTS